MDIIERIEQLRNERNWSVNYLALEANMTTSTLTSILKRGNPPKIETLQSLCDAFGITLYQFFAFDDTPEILSAEEKRLLGAFRKLSKERKSALITFIDEK